MSKASPLLRLRVRVDDIVYPGRSLARREGKVLFTDEGLPGELIEVEVVKEKADFIEARTIDVLEPSRDRREPRCSHYAACSPYQVIDYARQLEIKRKQVVEILGRSLGSDPEMMDVMPSPEPWGYRNKVRFHMLGKSGSQTLAYNSPGSIRDFVPVSSCRLVSDQMNDLLAATLDILNSSGTTSVKDIEVRETASGRELLLVLAGGKFMKETLPRFLGPELKRRFPLSGVIWLAEKLGAFQEIIVQGRDFVEEEVAGVFYRLGARSFFQVNRFLLEEALAIARDTASAAGTRRITDLYCGVGTFGLALAAGAEVVEGVESDPVNIGLLSQNIQRNGVTNFRVRSGTAEDWIERVLAAQPDLVLVDPPRKGLGARITKPLLDSPPPRILYLSCDPATLGRDLGVLLDRYDLRRLTLIDFFPQTPHIETLSLLERR